MRGVPETKKSLVIAEARRDPFLTVDEIARRVGTTPRYVRTTLSEARLSLAQLRKAYARRVDALSEGGQSRRGDAPIASFAPLESLKTLGGDVRSGEIAVRRECDPQAAAHCGVPPDSTLLIASRCICLDDEPILHDVLSTVHPLALRVDSTDLMQPLAQVLGLAGEGTQATALWLEAAPVGQLPPTGVQPAAEKPVLVIRQLWVDGDRPIGLETYWLEGDRLRLGVDFEGRLELTLQSDDFENRAIGQRGVDVG